MKPILAAIALLAVLALLTTGGSANPTFLEKEQSLQLLMGKRRTRRDLYQECYVEGCSYEEVSEALNHKAHTDDYWQKYQAWKQTHN